ncbi:hypothetical protein K2X05_11505 [bacterium]|nr:hypothetical protein [bacterium]
MLYKLFSNTLCCMFISSQVWAAPKEMPYTHFTAKSTAHSINSFKSIDAYVTWLGVVVPKEDLAKLRAEFVKFGVNLNDKFPKMMFKENKAYFDKNNSIIYGKDSVTVNGKKISYSEKPAAELFVDICMQLGCKKPTADFSLFPKAHALPALTAILLGAVALGAGAYVFTNGDKQASKRAAIAGGFFGWLFNDKNQYDNCHSGYGSDRQSGSCDVSYGDGGCYASGGGYGNGDGNYGRGRSGNRERIYTAPGYSGSPQQQCDQYASDLENPNRPYYGDSNRERYNGDPGGDQYQNQGDAFGDAIADKNKPEKFRGTTSVPEKKK